MKKVFVLLFSFIFVFLHSAPIYADVEYSIEKVTIDAFLQENGNVLVQESFTYDFDDEFNGITRSLIAKENTSIEDLKAYENGNELKIEKDGGLYKIYRSGDHETITIDIEYTIINGIEKYQDVAQFYWPFFDSSNESQYDNMTITVYPPNEIYNDVIAFGYNEAYGTEQILQDGSVVFHLGKVQEEKNGDIRVAYDANLFPAAPMNDKHMKDEILQAKEKLDEEIAAFEVRKEFFSDIAPFVTLTFGLYFFVLLFISWRKKQQVNLLVQREIDHGFFLPKQKMSLAATIHFTKPLSPQSHLLTASLLELVRKGNVEMTTEEQFTVVNRKVECEHERLLIELLFDEIGNGDTFHFDDLKSYTEDVKNHEKYYEKTSKWLKAIQEEIRSHQLVKKKIKLRWFIGLSSLLTVPFIVLFAIHEVYMYLVLLIFLLLSLLMFAFLYSPKTKEGAIITEEWKQVSNNFPEIESNQWHKWSKDDQMRAINYGIGINHKQLANNKKINLDGWNIQNGGIDPNMIMFLLIATTANHQFSDAIQTVSAASTSSSVGSGAGVGGGGGGSGAF